MPASNLLTLIDDIAVLLDDVALMSKVAAKKTAGVLGDDLAVNAEQVSGVAAERELPVVWAVFKGSMLNKCILVPAALLISAFIPWAITPILMIGGAYLCFEGSEKVIHFFTHSDHDHREKLLQAAHNNEVNLLEFEKKKIKGAIRTDFILSAEIIAISLGVIAGSPIFTQILTLSTVALLITFGVYGLVAGIVKLDDLGLYLKTKASALLRALGGFLLALAPKLMQFLSVAGTIAMFMVGGGILTHGLPHSWVEQIESVLGNHSIFSTLMHHLLPVIIGFTAGLILVAIVLSSKKLFHHKHAS